MTERVRFKVFIGNSLQALDFKLCSAYDWLKVDPGKRIFIEVLALHPELPATFAFNFTWMPGLNTQDIFGCTDYNFSPEEVDFTDYSNPSSEPDSESSIVVTPEIDVEYTIQT